MILGVFACLLFIGGTFTARRGLWGFVALIGLLAALWTAVRCEPARRRSACSSCRSASTRWRRSPASSRSSPASCSCSSRGTNCPRSSRPTITPACSSSIAGLSLVGSANDLIDAVPGPGAHQHSDLRPALPAAARRRVAGGGAQVFPAQHLLVGPAAVRLQLPLRPDRHDEPRRDPRHARRRIGPTVAGRSRSIALVTIVVRASASASPRCRSTSTPRTCTRAPRRQRRLCSRSCRRSPASSPCSASSATSARASVEAGRSIGTALSDQVPLLLWILAAVTMSLGNVLALLQGTTSAGCWRIRASPTPATCSSPCRRLRICAQRPTGRRRRGACSSTSSPTAR